MAAINIRLITEVVSVIDTGVRVSKDPPVRKAAAQFRDDVAQAAKSGSELVYETQASWRRHRYA